MQPTLRFLSLFALATPFAAVAQPASSPDAEEPVEQFELFAARPGEERLADALVGLRFVVTPEQLPAPGFPAEGVDVARVPLLEGDSFFYTVGGFLDEPVSRESLDRLVLAVRQYARLHGRSFLSIYLPPQDITGGYVQIVVSEARSEGEVAVRGARYFSERGYRAALRQAPGQPIDEAGLEDTVAWLNRNPYRRAVLAAEPGAEPGTTRLALRVDERRPWQVSAGYENTGSRTTDEDRVFAGIAWGNALGRGDQVSYRYSADPNFEHSESHAGSYTTFLPWRHTATLFGSWSEIVSEMPFPFAQEGRSWQAGARYDLPLRASAAGWERSLSLAADFKYSDNTLEFATIPITDNVTHVAQFGAIFTTSRRWESRSLGLTASLYASPGGLTGRNDDAAFGASRAGAKAAYVYGRLDAQFMQRLPRGFSWSSTAGVQFASGALLGTEQLNGGGSAAVRGYRESTAFGDDGVVLNNELHLPGFSLLRGRDQAGLFAFLDGAVLGTRGSGGDTFELASAGAGLNYRFGRFFSLRAAYGWTLKELPSVVTSSGHGHVSASFGF